MDSTATYLHAHMRVAGAIVAGGKSARMGENKALMNVGCTTILQRIVDCLTDQSDIVILNSNLAFSDGRMAGLAVIPDILQSVETPLAGIHAALVWGLKQGCEWIATVPADTPFLPADLTERLFAAATETNAAIAVSAGQAHYVIGIWSTGLAAELETAIVRDGLFRVRDWASRSRAAYVEWPVGQYDPFFNVNTPEDLAQARRLANELGI